MEAQPYWVYQEGSNNRRADNGRHHVAATKKQVVVFLEEGGIYCINPEAAQAEEILG